jgi:hypothetical protein
VHNIHLMTVANGIDNNLHILPCIRSKVPHLSLGELGPLPDLRVQLAALHILQHQYNRILLLNDLVNVDNARVVESDQHVDFVLGFEHLVLVDLDGEHLARVLADGLADSA